MGDEIVKGVSINGVELKEYLQKQEADKKTEEIEQTRSSYQHLKHTKHHIPYVHTKKPSPAKDKVARRVRHLSDREIREEYGIMKKPFKTQPENLIWLIIEKGPITVEEIQREMGWVETKKTSSVAAIIVRIWNAIGDEGGLGYITRYAHDRKYVYKAAEALSTSTEEVIRRFKLKNRELDKKARDKTAANKKTAALGQKPARTTKVAQAMTQLNHLKPQSAVTDTIETGKTQKEVVNTIIKNAVEQVLGVKVEVSGKVEIIIKLG